ncbi:phage baseplate assembly protein V [Mangrovicoccus sp. HB161399]|uniref:phage baseplate assembly protein V n=1 Tax=Mangrovicoccus sp. HB161399 TaxID=2720392 RepID=UPI0015532A4F|nr:phage baseplate assembly protein V [Mangrovicoccus sp. HB161399]
MNMPVHPVALSQPLTLGVVRNVDDPDGQGRVEIELHAWNGAGGQEGRSWARVAQPFAGSGYGAVFVPDVDDEVLVAFLDGDSRCPVVIGSFYTGNRHPPETAAEGGAVKRWALAGHAGTKVLLDESAGSRVLAETAGGVSAELDDSGGGSLTLTAGGSTVTLDSSGITIETGGTVTVNGSTISASAGSVSVSAGIADFSGVVHCNTLSTTTVVASVYTPGAGNVW